MLGAALCTTRDVTDAGWLPKQYQVGMTGRAIAPQLYIAVGVRGAFEHTVGIRRAGMIVAINKSAKAPIFKVARLRRSSATMPTSCRCSPQRVARGEGAT